MGEMINISLEEYKRLVQLEARANALMDYAVREKYSISGDMIVGILGIPVIEVEDGNSGE